MKVEEAVEPLNILHAEFDFAIAHGLVVVEIGQGKFDDAALEVIGGDFGPLRFGDDGFAAILLGENGGGDEFVPFLLEEGVHGLLFAALFGFGETLVLSL